MAGNMIVTYFKIFAEKLKLIVHVHTLELQHPLEETFYYLLLNSRTRFAIVVPLKFQLFLFIHVP